MEEGKGEQNSQNILNQEFFDTIKLSKKHQILLICQKLKIK